MPVFINPVPTGMPGMYTPEEYEEIQSILTEIAKKLGLEVAEKDNSSITLENGLQIFMTPNLEIYISNVGYPENINRESFQEKNVEEAMEFYQEYYYPMVSDLLNYQSPQRELSYRIDDNNRLSSSVTYVETAENPIEQFFHDQFNQTRFGYSASNYSEGDLLDPPRISIPYYHLEPFEVLDEIPLRSLEYIVEERKGREIFGQELKLEHIVRAEVFYYSYTTARYLSPIYRLYIHIEDPDENYESEEGQMLIVPIEVLAIPEEYEQ
ncbi:hypothetical protein ISALK_04515 [Isachenkonia alkalipeptolytica]|uniref:Uncharacterized protein n=2 Tax=Isachenkonia alkalipeptolytica TaxID=2565777 RepID=A0AA43XJK6_9CLOT|nr:hypothetical protein [Isachenkonia alkalipeptolytica]